MAEFIDDDGQLIETCDLGGNKILMFDASKAGAVANQLKSGNFLRQKKIFIKEAITV